MEKRTPGRPRRSDGVVGRQKIIEDLREVFRARANVDLSRKELARAIGITPALITYYFAEQCELVEELAVPVIEGHRIALSTIVNGPARPEQKLRGIISVLAELYGTDLRILELYKTLEDAYPEDYAEVATMTAILSDFFGCWRGASNTVPFEAIVLQGAVRGMCDFLERAEAGAAPAAQSNARTMPGEALKPLFEMFMNRRTMEAALFA